MTDAERHYKETGHNLFETWKVEGEPVTFCCECHWLKNHSDVPYTVKHGVVIMAEWPIRES